ncbi:hypothetical protein TI04_06260 [Achromatium sp. WMS2]|nr:hypothetical protein TI04_06260 [Achromatium sp. WMS2]
MEIELLEIRDFLAQHTPFGLLTTDQLDTLPKYFTIRYLKNHSLLPTPELANNIVIIRSGAIELFDNNRILSARLAEGNVLIDLCTSESYECLRRGATIEDTLLYLLPCNKFHELCLNNSHLNFYFSSSLTTRLDSAIKSIREVDAMAVSIGNIVKPFPVIVAATDSIQISAQLMTTHHVSSLMVMESGSLVGLITDSDLRSRCIAAGLSVQEPVSKIMTRTLETIPIMAPLSAAVMAMTRFGIQHLPVLDDGRPVGILTIADLINYQAINSAFLTIKLRKAPDLPTLVEYSSRLPALQRQLANAGSSAIHIGQAMSYITDSITVRLIELAEQQLGPAPVPYTWLSCGSQARREQTINADQDNAIIIDSQMKAADAEYFTKLSTIVCTGLDACGFHYCSGQIMAINPKWCQPIDVWLRYFRKWIEVPDPQALMLASIFFDLRPVYGESGLFYTVQNHILELSKNNSIFIAHMVTNALIHRPPLGFFRDFILIHDGKHNDTLDLKHQGIVPINDIARIYALKAGLTATNTSSRLQAAAEHKLISSEMAANLRDALELISSLRIHHQAQQIASGINVDNFLLPSVLSTLERGHLKDAFKIIHVMQQAMERSYTLGLMVN